MPRHSAHNPLRFSPGIVRFFFTWGKLERGKTRGQRGSCQLHPHQGGVALVSTGHANNKTIMKPGSAAWRVCSNRERVCVIEAPISTCRICSDWAPLFCDSIQIAFTSQLIYICQSIVGSPVWQVDMKLLWFSFQRWIFHLLPANAPVSIAV